MTDAGKGPSSHEFVADGFYCYVFQASKKCRRMIYWCGYLRIPPGHPWHGRTLGEIINNLPPRRVTDPARCTFLVLGFDTIYRDLGWAEQAMRKFAAQAAQAREAAHAD